ncbi:MAG: sigma-70 family RNA polymerase sigma factor [Bacteroidota bacterium]
MDRPITALLSELSAGDQDALAELMPQVYEELQRIAHRQLRGERAGHTFNTTALVHEAYEKLIGLDRISWQNRAHFFGMAATSMRRILINYAHRRNAQKRGGGQIHATFDEGQVVLEARPDDLLALDEALQQLEQWNARQSQVVTYKFFGGLTHEEIAEVLSVSVPTVRRDWRMARAWLAKRLGGLAVG